MDLNRRSLPLVESGGGCSCCSTGATSTSTPVREATVTTQTFPVVGLTCAHCVGAVSAVLVEIDGVSEVSVTLVPGGTSTVTLASDSPVSERAVAGALEAAGDYQLAATR